MLFFKKVKIWKYSFHIKILSAKLFTSLLNNKSKNNYWEFSPLFAKESSLEEKMGNANNRITASDFFWGLFCILIYFNPTLVSLHNKLISKSKFFYLQIRQKKTPHLNHQTGSWSGELLYFYFNKTLFFQTFHVTGDHDFFVSWNDKDGHFRIFSRNHTFTAKVT